MSPLHVASSPSCSVGSSALGTTCVRALASGSSRLPAPVSPPPPRSAKSGRRARVPAAVRTPESTLALPNAQIKKYDTARRMITGRHNLGTGQNSAPAARPSHTSEANSPINSWFRGGDRRSPETAGMTDSNGQNASVPQHSIRALPLEGPATWCSPDRTAPFSPTSSAVVVNLQPPS